MNPYYAYYSDETENFRSPLCVKAGDIVTVRLRAPKDLKEAPSVIIDNMPKTMVLAESGAKFDYYSVELRAEEKPFGYVFRVKSDSYDLFYTRLGISPTYGRNDRFMIIPGFDVPKWAIGTVMYQIFTDRFCNGNHNNDVLTGEYDYNGSKSEQVTDWYRPVTEPDVGKFYGGDLQGVLKKLDYLHDLGIETLYLNPIFVSPSNHKYDIQDYDHVDPHYTVIVKEAEVSDNNEGYKTRTTDPANLEASNEFFAEFMKEVHSRGMKVILDGVFNHCGSFNKWLDKEGFYSANKGEEAGAYNNPCSKYRDFFKFDNENDHDSYEGWWGYRTLPKLNYEGSERLCEYIINVAKKWVSPPYSVDGWRLDVAADLGHSEAFNHSFWKRFRKAVKEANPNAIIIAEHYGSASKWLGGDEWDTVMNYDAFMEPISYFLTGMEKHSDFFREGLVNNTEAFVDAMKFCGINLPTISLYTAMNELSNHDHSRFLTRTNRYVGRISNLGTNAASENIRREVFAEAVVFQMTWPGSPCIYYGDEAGLCGFTDPDNRRTYPWGHEDNELIKLHKDLIEIRNNHPVLRTGSLLMLNCSYGVIVYARFDSDETIITVINNNDCDKQISVSTEGLDINTDRFVSLMIAGPEGFKAEAHICYIEKNELLLNVQRNTAIILKNFKA